MSARPPRTPPIDPYKVMLIERRAALMGVKYLRPAQIKPASGWERELAIFRLPCGHEKRHSRSVYGIFDGPCRVCGKWHRIT